MHNMHVRYDRFEGLKALRRTDEGYLLCSGRVARSGVLEYQDSSGGTRRELVLEEELSRIDSIGSVALKPVTDGHPPVMVRSDNAREYQRGVSLQKVNYADGYVTIEMLLTDEELAQRVERGDATELSLGYHLSSLDETPGEHPTHGRYDAIQRGRKTNHIAVVERGRAGETCGIRRDEADIAYYSDHQGHEMQNRNDEALTEETAAKLIEAMAALTAALVPAEESAEESAEEPAMDEAGADDEERDDAADEPKPQKVKREDDEAARIEWFRDRHELVEAAKRYDIEGVDRLKNDELRRAIVTEHFGKTRADGAEEHDIRGLFVAAQEIARAREKSTENLVSIKDRKDAMSAEKAYHAAQYGRTSGAQ